MKKIIDFLINPSKAVSIVLIGLVVGLGSTLAYKWFENRDLKTTLNSKELELERLDIDRAKALSAESSCKKAFDKYKKDLAKKQTVLEQYKNSLKKGVSDEKINSVDDYINFTNSLYE